MQVFRRLVTEHGYRGAYDAVRRYIGKRRRRERPTFIPLDHDPGQRQEADFGHTYVDFPDGRRQVPVLLVAWAYSHAPFAMAMPTERIESILAGMVAAFEFFGCAGREIWWDNPNKAPRGSAGHTLRGGRRGTNTPRGAGATRGPRNAGHMLRDRNGVAGDMTRRAPSRAPDPSRRDSSVLRRARLAASARDLREFTRLGGGAY
jgi:hypothetical protein